MPRIRSRGWPRCASTRTARCSTSHARSSPRSSTSRTRTSPCWRRSRPGPKPWGDLACALEGRLRSTWPLPADPREPGHRARPGSRSQTRSGPDAIASTRSATGSCASGSDSCSRSRPTSRRDCLPPTRARGPRFCPRSPVTWRPGSRRSRATGCVATGVGGATRVGSWWGPALDDYRATDERTSEEIDIVGLARNRVTVVGEVRWRSRPMDVGHPGRDRPLQVARACEGCQRRGAPGDHPRKPCRVHARPARGGLARPEVATR